VSGADRPLLRVVRGDPTPAELAALTVVLMAKTAAPPSDPTPLRRSAWRDRRHLMRRPLHRGRDAWRTSARS